MILSSRLFNQNIKGFIKLEKKRLLTGDTPTGKLHLGHWVGSLENRIQLQDEYDCFYFVANAHAFTTRVESPQQIRQNTLDIVTDYFAAGIDPDKATVFVESEVPAIFELANLFSMLIPFPRLMRNPTIKSEIRDKGLGDNYSMGFLMYPIMQVADILTFSADVIPVGEDQIPLIELTREVARRFNQLYCGVDPQVEDENQIAAGGQFALPTAKMGRVKRLVGTGAPGKDGRLLKMSKSLNNSILLSDPPDVVKKKIMGMYTDPRRLRATDPGEVENNPLWIFHNAFNEDKQWVEQAKQRYCEGKIGDVECKRQLVEVIVNLLKPIQRRRQQFQDDPAQLQLILKQGADKANQIAEKTLRSVKETIHQFY